MTGREKLARITLASIIVIAVLWTLAILVVVQMFSTLPHTLPPGAH